MGRDASSVTQMGPVVGMGHKALRYHKRLGYGGGLDIESLYCSLMMLDSWERETGPIREALNQRESDDS